MLLFSSNAAVGMLDWCGRYYLPTWVRDEIPSSLVSPDRQESVFLGELPS